MENSARELRKKAANPKKGRRCPKLADPLRVIEVQNKYGIHPNLAKLVCEGRFTPKKAKEV